MASAQPHEPTVRRLVRELKTDPRFGNQICAVHEMDAASARHADWPSDISPTVLQAAAALGFERPYVHQAAAMQCLAGGSSVAIASGTASGKSLCYVVPALDALVRRQNARVLMLFPTKALARDQLAQLGAWDEAIPDVAIRAEAYDGDTPAGSRARIRRGARIIATNPDMLHGGILPHHARWSALMSGLALVVVDEMHVYRGVFGSHVANVLRRLRRVARFHGSDPHFVLTSATIANPAELAHNLTGDEVAVVDDDGSPRGRRTFVFYNPPVVDERLNIRRSGLLEAEAIARHFVAGGVQTIVFARSRQATELVVRYLGDGLAATEGAASGGGGTASDSVGTASGGEGTASDGVGAASSNDDATSVSEGGAPPPTVRGYRGGYTATERRAIERSLRDGELRSVVATTALELGIDIGQLDACVMAGYPGTIASTWQQSGRAGRRTADSVAVLVATASPLDQFIVRHPEYVLHRSPEHARIDADNLLILLDHVRCATFELPFGSDEAARPFGGGDDRAAPMLESSPALGLPSREQPPGVPEPEPSPAPGQSRADQPPGAPPPDQPPGASRPDQPLGAQPPESPAPVPSAGGHLTPAVADLLEVLAKQGVVRLVDDTWYWLADEYPAGEIGLRSSGPNAVTVVRRGSNWDAAAGAVAADQSAGKDDDSDAKWDVLGTVDRATAPIYVHPGAVYLHDGGTYRVESLDWERGRAIVFATDPATYTRASSRVDLKPTRIDGQREATGAEVLCGELEVRSRVTGYREIRFRTHETIGWGDVDLPEQLALSGGYWFTLSDAAIEGLRSIGRWRADTRTSRGPTWGVQRDKARERDGYRCRMCQAAERPGRQHDVHHIRPFADFGSHPGDPSAYVAANALDNLITLCPSCHRMAERALGLHGALSGIGHALQHVAALHLMCDARDIAVSTAAHAPWTGRPTVAVYERAVAGVGFGAALFALHEAVITAGAELIASCPCEAGCPSCVGPAGDGEAAAKAHAVAVLRELGA